MEARESQEVLHGLLTPLDLVFGYMDVFSLASAGQQCAECSIELGGGSCWVAIAASLLPCPPELGTLVHAFGRGCEQDSPSALWSFVPAVVSAFSQASLFMTSSSRMGKEITPPIPHHAYRWDLKFGKLSWFGVLLGVYFAN